MLRLTTWLLITVLLPSSVLAEVTTYTNEMAFMAALPGSAVLSGTDFDSLTAGNIIADGETVDGITFNYSFGGGVQMIVSDAYTTTSEPNFLGTEDVDLFRDGDNFTIDFAPQNAIGISIITADIMLDDDITLTFGGTTVSLVAADVQQVLSDGSKVYFLGIIDTENIFGTADIGTIGGNFFLYNVDDIVLALIPPDVVVPDLLTVTRGLFVAGDETSLAFSDNVDLSLQRLVTDIQSRTEFEVMGTSPTASPASFEITLEGAVFARSTVVQTIELWDYVAGAWELVDTRNATNMIDSTATVAAPGDLSRFVDQTTLSVEARIHFQSTSPRQRFASNTDQVIWTIRQ